MDYQNSMRQMGYGGNHRKERRTPDFWEVARGCGLGLACDDSHSQDGVETILIPETLWSDLPAVHVGAEWEPVECDSSSRSRSFLSYDTGFADGTRHGPLADDGPFESEDSAPAPISLRWDTTSKHLDSFQEAGENEAARRFEEWQLQERWKSKHTAEGDVPPHQMLDFQSPADLGPSWCDDGKPPDDVLSETTPTDFYMPPPTFPPVRASPSYNGGDSRSSSYSLQRSGFQRTPISKGGDVACLPPELTEADFGLGKVVSCSLSAISGISSCVDSRPPRPTMEFARVPRKCPPDAEVVDIDSHAAHLNKGALASQRIALETAAVMEASSSSSAAPHSHLSPSTSSATSPTGQPSEHSGSAVAASSPAVSKAEAGGGRATRAACTEQESTNDSDPGGDARADALSSISSSGSYASSSSAAGRETSPNGAPRPPECVAKLLFGRQATNRIMSSAKTTEGPVGSSRQDIDVIKV